MKINCLKYRDQISLLPPWQNRHKLSTWRSI